MSHHAGPDPTTIVLRVSPVALLAVAFLLVGLSPAVLTAPLLFAWLLVVPIFAAVWIIRVRTTVDANGLRVRGVATTREVTWEKVRGVRFPRRRAGRFGRFGVAVLTDDSEVRLPCVTFRDLPSLSVASAGRVPDPFASAADTAD